MSYYGIRFNQCPSRNVEQRAGGNGWKSLEDDVGRVLRRRGGPGCGVLLGGGRPGQGGSMREGLAAFPG